MSFCEDRACEELGDAGAMGVVHRNNTPAQQLEILKRFEKARGDNSTDNGSFGGYNWPVGLAVGLTDWEERLFPVIGKIKNVLVVLDVAHADQKQYWETVEAIKVRYPDIHLCIGTFGHKPVGFERYFDDPNIAWRTGVGGGSCCSTRIATGCGMPTLQAVLDLGVPAGGIVADGGIRAGGDIVKALAAGAAACMMGRVFAGSEEAAGVKIKDDRNGKTYKVYAGNASPAGKRGIGLDTTSYIEGVETLVEYSGRINEIVARLKEGVRSGFSYCGAQNLKELQEKTEFVRISAAGAKESLPHALI